MLTEGPKHRKAVQAFPPIISPTVTMSAQRRMRCEQLRGTQSSDAHPGSLTATPVPEADRTTARALGTCSPTPSVVLHSPPRDQKLPQCGQGAGPGGHVPYLAGPHLTPRIPPRRTRTQTHTEAGTGEICRQEGDLPGNHPAGNRVPMKRH